MWSHTIEAHGRIKGSGDGTRVYTPKVVGSYRDPMGRQAEEGIRINDDQKDPGVESPNID